MTRWLDGRLVAGWLLATIAIYFTSGYASAPAVNPDELCNLGWSRFLAGGHFYSMGGAGYCHPLYPALIALAQSFTGDTHSAYRAAILANSVFAATSLPLAVGLGMRHFRMSAPVAWTAGLMCVSYPALVAYSRYAWPESLLYPLTLLWLWSWCNLVVKPNRSTASLLLAATATLYFAHPRMIVFPICVGVASLTLWALRRTPESRRIALFTVFISLITIISMSLVKNLVLAYAWNFDPMPSVAFIDSSHLAKIPSLLARVGGQLLFAAWATFGLALVPLAYALRNLKQVDTEPATYLKVVAAPALMIASAALVALFVAHSDRFDTFFYGRYIGPLVTINLLVGLSLCGSEDSSRLSRFVLAIAAACLLVALMAPPSDPNADYSRIHVLGLSALLESLYGEIGSKRYALIIIAATAAAAVLGAILVRLKWPWAAAIVLSTFAALHLTGEAERTDSASAHVPGGELAARFSEQGCRIFWSHSIKDRRQNHQAHRIQYAFPECKVTFLRELDCKLQPPGILIVDAKTPGCPSRATFTYRLEPGLRAQILGAPSRAQ